MPVIVWMLIIFSASTDLGSVAQTSRFLVPFLRWIDPHISAAAIEMVQLIMRKGAHLTVYAILALLLWRALRFKTQTAFARSASFVLLLAGVYAATDEFHQSFVQSRTASPWDVVIDCCGAAVGVAICWGFAHVRSRDLVTLPRVARD